MSARRRWAQFKGAFTSEGLAWMKYCAGASKSGGEKIDEQDAGLETWLIQSG